jgi:hypothetical protein
MEDYGEYLEEFDKDELMLILNNSCFTLREARKLEQADRGL